MDAGYSTNSVPQHSSSNRSVKYIELALQAEGVKGVVQAEGPICLCVYGCGPGCNDFAPVAAIIDRVRSRTAKKVPFNVILNDLPENDFPQLLSSLADDARSYQHGREQVYSLASGVSFYEQILPANCVHIGYSANSMHWLKTSPQYSGCCSFMNAGDADLVRCRAMAKQDYVTFLHHRATELAPGGLLILSNNTVDHEGKTPIASFMKLMYATGKALMSSEELQAFAVPHYWRSPQEFEDPGVLSQCGFRLVQPSAVEHVDVFSDLLQSGNEIYAEKIVATHRSWSNTAVKKAFSAGNRSTEEVENALTAFWNCVQAEVAATPDQFPCRFQQCYTILQRLAL